MGDVTDWIVFLCVCVCVCTRLSRSCSHAKRKECVKNVISVFVFGSLFFAITWFTLNSGINGCNTGGHIESLLFWCFNSTTKNVFLSF